MKQRLLQWLMQPLSLSIMLVTLVMPALADVHNDIEVHKVERADVFARSENADTGAVQIALMTADGLRRLSLERNTQMVADMAAGQGMPEVILYKGQIEGRKGSWVRLSDLNGRLSGVYFDGQALFFVDSFDQVQNFLTDEARQNAPVIERQQMVVMRASDITHAGICGADISGQTTSAQTTFADLLTELSALTATADRKLDMALVGDTEWSSAFSGNGDAQMLSEMNIVDGIFSAQLGLSINVVDSRILTDNGPLTSTNPSNLLGNFRSYVQTNIGNPGLTHLFTGKNLDGSVIGIAYLSTVCGNFGVGVTQRFGSLTALVAAHEVAHNLGSPHDNESGSACASTPNGFLMNPGINGSDQFSSCSIAQMTPWIETASCIVSNSGVAARITSSPGLTATVGQAYQYNSSNTVTSEGDNVLFRLDFGPEGMTVTDDGEVNWVPQASQVGEQSVQITATNAFGDDTQMFSVTVTSSFIAINPGQVSSYGGSQDRNGSATVSPDNSSIQLQGNTWKRIPFSYRITPDTMLEVTFQSSREGEIQGIGLDTDDGINNFRTFNLYGTQNWGIRAFRYTGQGDQQTFVLPVGQYYTGQMNVLFFANDDDVPSPQSNSQYQAIRVYEATASAVVDFTETPPSAYGQTQDGTGSVTVTQGGRGLELMGNRWQKVSLAQTIRPDTVLTFEFRSNQQGEVHGIGFDSDEAINDFRTFRLHGTQNWGIGDFQYTGNGDFQRFSIPIGEYYSGEQRFLFFANDHDVSSPDAHSEFRNILIE